ncbi:hypothetical protein SERLADRAFT_452051 [Serpula lacrymans var. lacrymans S7.9]|uniref:Trafficking protein particle complex subunit 11 domain-containing protein n=1 Tax=Serpula lacrymans var. lacrymans (strain S7.9) TaxID=578457 RepID=F8P643_SERL9|nr:uncharacterized protein SERLADRAFT_452051 [Serpula lacrymans var. lacrymans S7.9]EGO20910.1 hypothetical protein SERLADRAFT_452051 [Serpula lacrymans var. lacrymans S7.9]
MSVQHVVVTYATLHAFRASESWIHVHDALRSQLPLRNIHWKSASRPTLRTIQELGVSLVPLDSIRDELTSQIPVTLLEKPFLNLYIVFCEDVEAYRTTVKRQIKDWHNLVIQKKNQEWLILHIVRPDARTTDRSFFNMKGSVLDKIKADFNVDKRDRCVQIAWSTGLNSPAIWADLINKFKDGLLSAFDSAVSQREDEVKRSESQRHMPGWNFCTFFILKESLATSFEGVNLYEDALIQYNELEASFLQVLREKNLSWFGSLIHPAPKDDSSPLLSVIKKPYRDLILANTISIFDFRIYLLARQCALLSQLRQPIEICKKTISFLETVGRRLREVKAILPEYFIETWVFSSALSVVDQCDVWAAGWKMEGSFLAHFNANKGELVDVAKRQLDVLGVEIGHLPSKLPFSLSLPSVPTPPTSSAEKRKSSQRISQSDIISAIGDRELFYDLYITTCNRAIDLYAKAGRRKFALKLHGALAALDVHRERLSNALTIFASLPAHYAPHMWSSLESFMLFRAIEVHAGLGKPHDREWIHIILSFLKTHVNDTSKELLMPEDDMRTYVSQVVGALKAAASELDTDLAHPDHPAISMRVMNGAKKLETEDSCSLDIVIHNHLPCDIPIDQVSVVLTGRDGDRLCFKTNMDQLSPGKSKLTLFCPTSSWGTYVLESSEVQMSRLQFQWNRKVTADKAPSSRYRNITLVRIPQDSSSLDIRIQQPRQIELGSTSKILLKIFTGRNEVSKASIKLSPPPGIQFKFSEALLESDGIGKLEITNDSLTLLDAPKDSTIAISVPHSDASAFHAMKVAVEINYITTHGVPLMRTLRAARVVAVSLPISVNVEDFFRGKRLFSKFTVSTTTHQHVRIRSAQLVNPEGELESVKIAGCRPGPQLVTVTPAIPANFLFSMESSNGPVREALNLVIRYRLLREEVESLIHNSIEAVIPDYSKLQANRHLLIKKLVAMLEGNSSWVELYSLTGELKLPPRADPDIEFEEAIISVDKVLSQIRPSDLPDSSWSEIIIPVDMPVMNIVVAVQLRVLSTPFCTKAQNDSFLPVYAGQPISATLTIKASFHWGDADTKPQSYTMRFDVEETLRDWLICGRKRGDLSVQDGETYSIPVTLIALRHGELALPKVAVRPLPLVGDSGLSTSLPSTDTYQLHGAETILVLPRGGRSTFVVDMGGEN